MGSAEAPGRGFSVLMIAYTNYENDPRVLRAAEAAVEAGLSVDVIALRRPGQPAVEVLRGVRVHRLAQTRYRGRSKRGYIWAYGAFFVRVAVAATRMFLSQRYRVVHVNNMPDVLVFAVAVPKLLGARIILDIHDPMPETFGSKYAGRQRGGMYRALVWMERLSVAFADRTLTVNEPVRDVILASHGHPRGAIDVVANFADERIFQVLPSHPVTGLVRFVYHGTILERYGLRTLIEALARVRRRDTIRVRIIGEGDFGNRLRELIHERGVADIVEFRNQLYPVHELPGLLSDCHVGLVPLDVTPVADLALPLKLVEYTCLGLPSVVSRTTAISHYMSAQECFYYSPGDAVALANTLDAIAEDPGQLDERRERLHAARERLSWQREKAKYLLILRALACRTDNTTHAATCKAG